MTEETGHSTEPWMTKFFTIEQLKYFGLSAKELKDYGVSLQTLIKAGFSAKQLTLTAF